MGKCGIMLELTPRTRAKAGESLFFGENHELFNGKTAGADQASQCAFGNFPVIGHGQGCHPAVLDQNHMTAALPHQLPTILGKRFDDFATLECR